MEALRLRIKNSVQFPEADLYEDTARIQTCVSSIADEILKPHQIELLNSTLLKAVDPVPKPFEESTEVSLPYIEYDSLSPSTFRLLVLHPSELQESPVKCSLIVDSSENRPKYSFLSHSWGNTLSQHRVVIDGRESETRENLLQALVTLRQKNQAQVLWVDA